MARPIWNGQIAFGLVSVPVSLHSAERRADLSFRLLDSRDKQRVRYERVNESTGAEVPWDKVVKAYEYDKDNYVVIDEEELKAVAPEVTQTVHIEDFVDADKIDPVYFEKPYYLVPEKQGEKGYALLRETLRRTKRVGVARVVIRSREYLSVLMVHGDLLVLDLLRFHQELKDPSEFKVPGRNLDAAKVSKKEVDMAVRLVESMTSEWKPAHYKDEYRSKLLEWIEERAEAGDEAPRKPKPKEPKTQGRVIQFVDLLERSLADRAKTRTAKPNEVRAAAKPKTRERAARAHRPRKGA
jgi:DNA end-binding protein Ku